MEAAECSAAVGSGAFQGGLRMGDACPEALTVAAEDGRRASAPGE
jgi:hypothetical protein